MSFVVEKRKDNDPHWIKYIKNRIANNKNFVCPVTGQTGSGKSWTSIALGEMLDPDFCIDNIVFKGSELMKLISSGKLKKGSCIVWEETGVTMGHTNWQSATNKALSYLLQTFRHRNFILFMTLPYLDFLDASARKLIHAQFEVKGIDRKNKKTKIKPLSCDYNGNVSKYYKKYLRVITNEGAVPVQMWKVPAPSKEIIEQYEKKKLNFTQNLFEDALESFEKQEVKENKVKTLTIAQEEILNLLKKGLIKHQILNVLDIKSQSFHAHLNAIRKKNITITPVKEEGGNKVLKYEVIDNNQP